MWFNIHTLKLKWFYKDTAVAWVQSGCIKREVENIYILLWWHKKYTKQVFQSTCRCWSKSNLQRSTDSWSSWAASETDVVSDDVSNQRMSRVSSVPLFLNHKERMELKETKRCPSAGSHRYLYQRVVLTYKHFPADFMWIIYRRP